MVCAVCREDVVVADDQECGLVGVVIIAKADQQDGWNGVVLSTFCLLDSWLDEADAASTPLLDPSAQVVGGADSVSAVREIGRDGWNFDEFGKLCLESCCGDGDIAPKLSQIDVVTNWDIRKVPQGVVQVLFITNANVHWFSS
mmetsp:Transcript_16529/g.33784  ORF Transcript_16529/g.33784 Transcript_16529/m.33784 type:complete len:143 (-) Transcript_16529:230-658(-)